MRTDIGAASTDAFLRDHREWVFRCALQIVGDVDVAEDITQEALLRASRSLHRLQIAEAAHGWLRQIVVRRALTELSRRRPTSELRDVGGGEDRLEDLAVRHTLARLKPEQQVILALSVGEGLSYEEIAEALSIPSGTVGSRIYAAKAAFRTLWEAEL